MGSLLFPIVANIFMETLEEKAINTFAIKPKIWLRYMNDTYIHHLVPWRRGTQTLISMNISTTNTPLLSLPKKNGCIPFLDVLVSRRDSQLQTKVYRQPTHTNRCIHLNSNHHPRVLRSTMQCLKNRAHKICSDERIKHQRSLPTPRSFSSKWLSKITYQTGISKNNKEGQTKRRDSKHYTRMQEDPIILPYYVKDVSEGIENHLGMKTIFKSGNTLRQSLVQVKNPLLKNKQEGVTYEVPCADCDHVYIGETGRTLKKRLKEHDHACSLNI